MRDRAMGLFEASLTFPRRFHSIFCMSYSMYIAARSLSRSLLGDYSAHVVCKFQNMPRLLV